MDQGSRVERETHGFKAQQDTASTSLKMVGQDGVEPSTHASSTRRSTAELQAQNVGLSPTTSFGKSLAVRGLPIGHAAGCGKTTRTSNRCLNRAPLYH